MREIVAGSVDWEFVLSAAAENSVVPLLARQVSAHAADLIPSGTLDRLKAAARANTLRCLTLTGELLRVLGEFRSRGIAAIPYKGPVLAAQAYGDVALREYEDLDIILRHKDLPIADDAMRALGYRARFPWIHSPAAAASLVPGEYNYQDDSRRIIVELHTELTLRHFPIRPDLDDFSQRLVSVSLSGHEVKTFCAEDALPILCIHGAKDFWERIVWIADIAELVQSGSGFDWDEACRRAELMKAERMLHLGLALAAGLLDAPLPLEVTSLVAADQVATTLAKELKSRLLAREAKHLTGGALFQYRRKMVAGTLEGWRYTWRLAVAPAEEDWEMARLPRPLAPLYIALRPLRLLQKYGWTGRGTHRSSS